MLLQQGRHPCSRLVPALGFLVAALVRALATTAWAAALVGIAACEVSGGAVFLLPVSIHYAGRYTKRYRRVGESKANNARRAIYGCVSR